MAYAKQRLLFWFRMTMSWPTYDLVTLAMLLDFSQLLRTYYNAQACIQSTNTGIRLVS